MTNLIELGKRLGYPLDDDGCCYGISNYAILDTMNRAMKGESVFSQVQRPDGAQIDFTEESFLFWHRFIKSQDDIFQRFQDSKEVLSKDLSQQESLQAYFNQHQLWPEEAIDSRARNFINAMDAFYGCILIFQSGTKIAQVFSPEDAPFIVAQDSSVTLASDQGSSFNSAPSQQPTSKIYAILGDNEQRQDTKVMVGYYENFVGQLEGVIKGLYDSKIVLKDGSKVACMQIVSRVHANCVMVSLDSDQRLKLAFVDHDNLSTFDCLQMDSVESRPDHLHVQQGFIEFTEKNFDDFTELHKENQSGLTDSNLVWSLSLYGLDQSLSLCDTDLSSLSFDGTVDAIFAMTHAQNYDEELFRELFLLLKQEKQATFIEFVIRRSTGKDDADLLGLILSLKDVETDQCVFDINSPIEPSQFTTIELCARSCSIKCMGRLLQQPNIDLGSALDISCKVSEVDLFPSDYKNENMNSIQSIQAILSGGHRLSRSRNSYISNINSSAVIQKRIQILEMILAYEKQKISSGQITPAQSVLGLREGTTALMRYIFQMQRDDSYRAELMPMTFFLVKNSQPYLSLFDEVPVKHLREEKSTYDNFDDEGTLSESEETELLGKNILAYAAASSNVGILQELMTYRDAGFASLLDPAVCDQRGNSVFKYLNCFKRRVFNHWFEKYLLWFPEASVFDYASLSLSDKIDKINDNKQLDDFQREGRKQILLNDMGHYFFSREQMSKLIADNPTNDRGENILMQSVDNLSPKNRATANFTPVETTKAHLERFILFSCKDTQDKNKMIEAVDQLGKNALIHAVEIGYLDIIDDLCTPNSLHCQDKKAKSALHYACELGHGDIVKKLIDRGVDIDLCFIDNQEVKRMLTADMADDSVFGRDIDDLLRAHAVSSSRLNELHSGEIPSRLGSVRQESSTFHFDSKKTDQDDSAHLRSPKDKPTGGF